MSASRPLFASLYVLVFALSACSSDAETDSNTPPPPADLSEDDGTEDTSGDAVAPPDVGDPEDIIEDPADASPDEGDAVEPEVTEQEDASEGPEDAPWSGCVSPVDCVDYLDLGVCETAGCDNGECVVFEVPGCCEEAADCEGYGETCCETISCDVESNTCLSEPIEGCCQDSSNCDDQDAKTNDFCATACTTNGCVFIPPLCDNDVTYLDQGFESADLADFSLTEVNLFDMVSVTAEKGIAVDGTHGLYFGDPQCQTYYNGPLSSCEPSAALADEAGPLGLEISAPPVVLSYEEPAYLAFWVRMAAEPGLAYDNGTEEVVIPLDYLRITADTGEGAATTIWRSTDALGVANTTGGQWSYQVVDLSAFKGKTTTLRFAFIADETNNFNTNPLGGEAWYGAYIDAIVVRTACVFCVPGSTCALDYDGCTNDICSEIHADPNNGICTYEIAEPGTQCQACAQPGDCGDDFCVNYTCDDQLCGATIKPECCQSFSSFPFQTATGDVAYLSFEDLGISTWVVDDPYDDNVTWQVDDAGGYTGTHSLYFGDPTSQTYEANSANPAKAVIWTPSFQPLGEVGVPTVLSFWLKMETEYDGVTNPTTPEESYDMLSVWVEKIGEEPVRVWESATTINNSTDGRWWQVGIDLGEWNSAYIRVGFEFDSKSSFGNDHGGVRIDDLTVAVFCESECLGSIDCDDGDVCTTDSCELGLCRTQQDDETCCSVDADCVHENTCVDGTCDEGTCSFAYTSFESCCSEGEWLNALSTNFEAEDTGWQATEATPPVVWRRTDVDARSGDWSYTFSDPGTGTYATLGYDPTVGAEVGQPTVGSLISPPVVVPPFSAGRPYAEFWFRMETEWDFSDKVNFDPVFIVDELRVKVAVDGDLLGALPVWDSHYTTNTTLGSWVHTFVNLEAYRGQSVQLIFEFASGDGNYNDFAGPFVDDVDFGTTCKADAQIQCMDGGDCAAPGDCAAVACTQDFACQYTPLNTIQCCEPADIQSMAITFEDTDELQAAGWEVSACEPSETSPTSQVDLNTTWKSASVVTGAGIEPKSGDGMLYFGNGLDYGGATQTAACATAVSPAVTLEDNDVPWTLSYWLYMDIEPASDCPPIGGIPFVDVFTLELLDVDSGESTLMLLKDNLLCNEYDDWTFRDFDLSPWLGKTIRFRFKFNSWDEQENFGKGIAFDEFRFERGCPEF